MKILKTGSKSQDNYCHQCLIGKGTSKDTRYLSPKGILFTSSGTDCSGTTEEGIYLASESSFYRVLRKAKELKHRSRSKPPSKRQPPIGCAMTPGEIWVSNISWLAGPVIGVFYYLYFVMDLCSKRSSGMKPSLQRTWPKWHIGQL